MRYFKHRFGLRAAVITAVAMLIAQIGAMAHAYSHDSGMERASAHQSNSVNHDFCSDCLNFAPLLSAAGTPAALPGITPQERSAAQPSAQRSLLSASPALAFRSRAPPAAH